MEYLNRSKEELIVELLDLKQELAGLKESLKYPTPESFSAKADSQTPESFYAKVLNALPDTITITNLQGNILYSSPQTIAMFGYSNPEDYLNKPLFEFLASIDHERAKANLTAILNGFQTRTHEYIALKFDQSTFNIEVNGEIIHDGEGNPSRVIFVTKDITDRKSAERKIEKLNRLNLVISQTNRAIIRLREKDLLIPELCRIAVEYGKFRMAWIGMVDKKTQLVQPVFADGNDDGFLSAIRPISVHELPEMRSPIGSAIRDGNYLIVDDFITDHKAGEWKDEALKRGYRSSIVLPIRQFDEFVGAFTLYSSLPNFFIPEEIGLLDEFVQEINFAFETIETENKRKQSEIQLKKLFLAVEQSPVSVVITDLSGAIEYVNPSFLHTTGYTMEEIIGANPRILKSGKTDKAVYDDLWKTITAGKEWETEWIDKKKNGELFWEHVTINPIIADDGKITNYLAVKQDITNRKNSEELRRDFKANLELKIVERTEQLFQINKSLELEIAARKLASFETAEALDRLNKIADRVPGFVYEYQLNPDGSSCFPFASEGIRDIYRVTPREVTTDASVMFSRIHPDDMDEFVASIQLSARDLTLWRHEYRVKFDDQTVLWLLSNALPQRLTDGTILWHGFSSDITERRHSEAALQASEKRFSLFMDYLPALVFIKDLDSRMIYSNNAMDKALGASAWTGKSLFELFDHQTSARIIEDDQKTLRLGYQLIEESFTNLDGKLHNYETQKFIIPQSGEKPLLGGIGLDITERKLSEEKFSRAFHSNSALMAISFVGDGRLMDVNDMFVSKLGYSREELIGKTSGELNLYAESASREIIFENLAQNFAVREVELEIRTKTGELITGLFSADYIFIGNQKCVLAVFVDISDRKKIELELMKAKNEAEKANHAKSEFLSRMSHELRTPLNSILGFAQLLQMGELHSRQRNGINHISQSGKHLLDLINEVLDISGIEAGRLSFIFESIQLNEIILEMIDSVQPLTKARHLNVELVNSSSGQLFVWADRQRLKQVLMNLLSNAIKYNKDAGSIIIQTRIMADCESGIPPIRISITDTGIGIMNTDIAKLFTPFERIGAENTTIEGSGLGLTVVKKLIEAMDGTIGLESISGKGSTFWIELPQSDSQPESISTAVNFPDKNSILTDRIGTILYIEDNLANIELVEQILAFHRSNIRLVSHKNGSLAVSLAIEEEADLILLDLNLPDIHGYEVFRLLQEEGKTRNIPVVIVSADAMPAQINKLLKAGAKNYLTKPLNVITLLKMIDTFIVPMT